MRYKLLALLPFVFVAALFVTSLVSADSVPVTLTVANEAGKVLGVAGSVTAALAFERGEYMWRAWLLYASCYLLLLVNDGLGAVGGGPELVIVGGVVIVLANAAGVASTWMLARAWTVAGLGDEDVRRSRKYLFYAGAAAVVIAITAWPVGSDVKALVGGDWSALVAIGSDLGDMLTLALIAPVMLTALALRGGLLRWPWSLLAASSLAWLVYDVTSDAMIMLHIGGGLLLVASESVRLLANGWVFGAGVAQRLVLAGDDAE